MVVKKYGLFEEGGLLSVHGFCSTLCVHFVPQTLDFRNEYLCGLYNLFINLNDGTRSIY